MGTFTDNLNFQYNSIMITRYVYSLPLKRRILAKFFEKYRVTKEEYDEWFYKVITK